MRTRANPLHASVGFNQASHGDSSPIVTFLSKDGTFPFGSIQLDPEQLFFECLRFVNDEIWIYWRQRCAYSYDDTLEFDHKYSVSVIDLLSLSLFDVLSWLINLFDLQSDFTVDDFQDGLWRFELRREAKEVSDDGEKLYIRCAFSHPFEFKRRDLEFDQEGGIYPLETTVTSVAQEQLRSILNKG